MHVTFEDFAKLDIRIGTVISCERIERSNRLLKVVVDLGSETKQVVAGFGHLQEPASIVGKQIPIVVNIPAVELGGVLSEGIFIALDDEHATLLQPATQVANGTKLK